MTAIKNKHNRWKQQKIKMKNAVKIQTKHKFFIKKLRKNSTDAEHKLWYHLRSHRLNHLKFRRQISIGKYIVDFICFSKRLVIEIDGGQHNEVQQKNYDIKRTKYLNQQGFHVLRFWNNEVLQNVDGVLTKILSACDSQHIRALQKETKSSTILVPFSAYKSHQLFKTTHKEEIFMTTIDDKTVKNIAHLARLAINEQDISHYSQDLSNIITLIEQMNEIDTDHIEPMAHPVHAIQRLRNDEITETVDRETLQQMAPQVEGGLYLVPAVLDQPEVENPESEPTQEG